MRLTIETPALLFAPIAFLVLAYTNRYSALTRLARELLREYATDQEEHVFEQILLVRRRVNVIRSMLTLAALAMSFSVFTILALYEDWDGVAKVLFARRADAENARSPAPWTAGRSSKTTCAPRGSAGSRPAGSRRRQALTAGLDAGSGEAVGRVELFDHPPGVLAEVLSEVVKSASGGHLLADLGDLRVGRIAPRTTDPGERAVSGVEVGDDLAVVFVFANLESHAPVMNSIVSHVDHDGPSRRT